MSDSGRRGPDPEVRSETSFPSEVEPSLRAALRDRYVIEHEIGRGGMGVVFRARDLKHDRSVAIKALRPAISDSVSAARFLREIRTAAQLVHPNIVTVYDSGQVGETLYFVMPFVEGESLRQRLDREGRLALPDALHITRQIAGALNYAHNFGVVHRDIKPENILVSRHGDPWLVDFGVAQATAVSTDQRLTQSGFLLGSPLYISPEQAADQGDIDGRADFYSLGCVLYEMISGAPPFKGSSVQAVLMKHLVEHPVPLTTLRPDVPAALDHIVARMLSKPRTDRFQTAAELEAALRTLEDVTARPPAGLTVSGSQRWKWLAIAGGVAAFPILLGLSRGWFPVSLKWLGAQVSSTTTPLDSTRYVLIPFVREGGIALPEFEDRLGDAIAAWSGLDVVDQSQVKSAGSEIGFRPNALARRLDAGRIIVGRISPQADGVRIYAELIDANQSNVKLAKQRATFLSTSSLDPAGFRELAGSLLLQGVATECVQQTVGTSVLSAVWACDRAVSGISDGDLARADSALEAALRVDPTYARAALRLAQIRSWIVDRPSETVGALITIALQHAQKLSPAENQLAQAQSQMQAGEYAAACKTYGSVTSTDSLNWVAWLGLGECHRRDDAVIPAPNSPSGWSFRSSYHQAANAYWRAFELHPSLLAGYRDRSFAVIRRLLMTSSTDQRSGRSITPDKSEFRAYPELLADTLGFVPIPLATSTAVRSAVLPRTVQAATDRQRDRLQQLATKWVRTYPESPAAGEALAVALELDANPAAVRAVHAARTRALSPTERFNLAAAEVWLRVKFGLPDQPAQLDSARILADSMLRNSTSSSPVEARSLAAMAILLGRPNRSAQLARMTAAPIANALKLSVAVVEPAQALLAFAAAGQPVDSMKEVEAEFDRALSNLKSGDVHLQIRQQLLTQATMIAFPAHALQALPSVAATGGYTSAELWFQQGQHEKVRQFLDGLTSIRAGARGADITIDALYVEAWLLNALGDTAGAVRRLDPVLNAIRFFPPGRLDEMARAGTLLRAMALRAELANRVGDRESARRWAAAVTRLWSGAEPSLQPVVSRMRTLTANASVAARNIRQD